MRTKLNFFWMLLAVLVWGVNDAWAAFTYETVTYDFGTYAKKGGTIKMSSTQFGPIKVNNVVVGNYADYMAYTENGVENKEDISRFAFRYTGPNTGNDRGWYLRNNSNSNSNSGQFGLWCTGTNYTPQLGICSLHAGDKVTITYSGANITYESGAHGYKTSTNGVLSEIPSGEEITISQDGDMVIKANDGSTYIQTIEIKTLQTKATYSITTQEDVNNHTRSTTFAFTGEGRLDGNTIAVPFMEVVFGSSQNRVIVEGLGNDASYLVSHIPDWNGYWHIWFNDNNHNIPAQGTFYKFKPTARGKLQVKGYLSGGSIHLYEVDESNGTFTNKADGSNTGTGSISVPTGWVTLEKGKTYYLCEDPNQPSQNAFLLHEFTYTNEFNMDRGLVLENGSTSGSIAVKGATTLERCSVKKVSGNIDCSHLSASFANNTLSISGIGYTDATKDEAGVIILDLEFDAGDATLVVTIPYSAEKGHIWNFYDTSKSTNPGNGILDIGQYKTSGSPLQQETDNGEWEFTYRVINQQGQGTHDPMYKNVHDMEGNNADMIWDTEGLWFETATKQSILYNENDVNNAIYTDRYVGILPGGSFTIPGLKKDDRVLIFMGSGDGSGTDVCFFNITNALDAIGSQISPSDTYKAGGTLWNGDHGDNNLRGAYHFIAAADGPMTFYMNGGSMTKIYSIEIYQGKHKWTDDATRVPERSYNNENYNAYAYQLLNTYQTTDETVAKAAYQLHYRGKGEALRTPTVVYTSGNITVNTTGDSPNLVYQQQGNEHNIFYKSVKGEFGLFRMRIDCMDLGGHYVTDYGMQNISVGYLDKMNYPYTWDFTDLMKYAYTGNANRIPADISWSTAYDNANYLYEYMNRYKRSNEGVIDNSVYYNSVEVWKENPAHDGVGASYSLHLRNNRYSSKDDNEGSGELAFVGGGQLYAGSEFITEASGLGIIPQGYEDKRNGRLQITDEGLYLYEQSENYWGIKIPEVPADAAVYVRAKAISGRTPATTTAFTYTKQTNDGDYIYALKGTGADMTINLSNMIVKKIAVATDVKTVNKFGWNTESREHAIDPSLLPYMTGKDFRTYIVTAADRENNTVTLTRIDGGSATGDATLKDMKLIVPGATKKENGVEVHDNGSRNACIIRNAGGEAVDIFGQGSGFHLFVPDMLDEPSVIPETNKLKAQLSNTTTTNKKVPRDETIQSTTYNNYAFTYKYKKVNNSGDTTSDEKEGVQAFYRIVSGGASSDGHQAYLSIPAPVTPVAPAGARAMAPAYEASQPAEDYSILFQEWDNIEQLKGDVNGDGWFNKLDVNTTADYVAGRPAGIFKGLADMNGDGRVDIVDLTLMIRKISGE